ncbi:MAG: ComEC/Rec2 family competence protein [Chlamydiota bacterium]
MIKKGAEALSLFFKRHPALLPSLFFLLGLALAASPSFALCLPVFSLFLLRVRRPSHLMILCTIGVLAFFYGKHTKAHFPENISSFKGSALFSLSEIKMQHSHFKKALFIQGSISSMQGKLGEKAHNIPCSFSIPSSICPLQFQKYQIFGTLEKKENWFSFTPDPKTPWIGQGRSFCLPDWKFKIKKALAKAIKKAYPDTTVSNFFIALTLGNLDDKLLRFSFNKLGLQHILAISGFHFSLLSLFIGCFFRLIFKEKIALIALLGVLTLYFLLLHNAPSIFRAYFAITLYLIGRLRGYRPNALNLLGVTLLLELIILPQSITNLGFQLSFLATGSILLLFPLTFSWMEKLLPKRNISQALLLHPLEKIIYLISCALRSTLAVNLAVYLTLIPTCLWYFTSFPLVSLLYNLFIPFTIFISLLLFLVAFFFGIFIPPLSTLIHQGNEIFTGKILQLLIESPNCLDFPLTLPFISEPLLYIHLMFIFSLAIIAKNKTRLSSRMI